ncbi:MAG: type VI secretion system baseplate subunit TssF [Solidesulfovibrio sp. DCME]|uniref:type VI secretion system baseplate subunit TssF n=1 Tax=Solidesulfovibrio sp. DCME TaxID=3447380 RepID=UPI003D0C6BDC
MISAHYQRELAHLKVLAVEFAKAHPALAPLLSGPSTDPDVERLLEGTAFLTGLVREKLEDELPEVVHNLLQLIFPHYLRPVPSSVIMQFSPKPGLLEVVTAKAGTRVASVPVDGTKCLFTTCFDVDIQPLRVVSASLERRPGLRPNLTVSLELTGLRFADWTPSCLRFLIGGGYGEAANRFALLMRYTKRLVVRPGKDGKPTTLPRKNLHPVGFADDEALLPYPGQSFPGYRVLQEFFLLPHKFLFFDVTGLTAVRERGEGAAFDIVFEMDALPDTPPEFRAEHLILGATPAVNTFPHSAEPIVLDRRTSGYRIRPSDMQAQNYQVFAVSNVTGFAQGSVRQKEYVPFQMFTGGEESKASYNLQLKPSPLGETMDQYIEVSTEHQEAIVPETLSVDLVCTNFRLPERLQVGDIGQATENSPELCQFTNISRPTATVQPPIGDNLLWRLLSHISLNYMPLADEKSLASLLRLYIFPDSRDQASIVANNKRVDGILKMTTRVANRLFAGSVIRGYELALTVNSQNFASPGDLYVFSSVLDFFLAGYSGINCYTSCTITDYNTGEKHIWPIRLGEQRLL